MPKLYGSSLKCDITATPACSAARTKVYNLPVSSLYASIIPIHILMNRSRRSDPMQQFSLTS